MQPAARCDWAGRLAVTDPAPSLSNDPHAFVCLSAGLQTDAYARLIKLEAQWYDLTRKNAEIELACAYLEVELAPLKARAAAAAAAEAAARRADAEAEVGPMATDSTDS